MKYRYGKFIPDLLDELDMDELMSKLSDLLLASGFRDPYFSGTDDERSMQALYDAILDALLSGGVLPDETLQQLLGDDSDTQAKQQLEQLIQQIIERMQESGYVTEAPDLQADQAHRGQGQAGQDQPERPTRFEVTDKALDFLGFRALRDLLGSLGKSSFGRHDTRDLATGIEASGATKSYEFGDTLNLDVNATLRSAIQREGLGVPINLEYADLMVHQTEYQSSCATVLMLDCSHSMILYGEDRFTPAKRVALALTHLIRTQYPGDSLRVVLFHDSAEEIPLSAVARAQVGPYHTNTREGLRLSRRILMSQRKDMRQIIMITDGKPSAMTTESGRIYKNPMGLDPMILRETFREVAACRRSGIMINTFMLADDYYLVDFVKRVTEICQGKAYFTTTITLGQYILMDYVRRRTRRIR